MSLSDFDALTPQEFSAICEAYSDNKQNEYQAAHQNAWKRVRFLALFFLMPYSKKTLTERDIAVFDWEKAPAKTITQDNSKEAFEAAKKRFGNG